MSGASHAPQAITRQGQPALRLQDASGASLTVALHGAHVLSWRGAGGDERLYLSPTSRYGAGQAIRGGVPVIFPQFAQRGPDTSLPRHGFARTRAWRQVDGTAAAAAAEGASLTLRLVDDEATRAMWPHRFELDLTLRLHEPHLDIGLICRNVGDSAFVFSVALHSYFAVDRVESATLEGLQGTRCLDTTNGREHVEAAPVLAFDGSEIDRIYWAAGAAPLTLAQRTRRLRLEAVGLPDVVVWNPGPAKAAQLSDLPAGDARRFVCVEAAAIEPPLSVAPGACWAGEQRLTALGGPN